MERIKKLTVPQTSSSFQWNAPEVVSLCSQGSLYIMAKRLPLMWPGENVGYYSYFFLLWLHPETNCIVFLSMAILGKRVSVMFLSYLTQNPKINRKEGSKHSLVLSSIPGMSISNTMVSYHVSPFLNFRMTHPAYHIRQYAWFVISVGNFRYHKYTGHFRYHKHSKPCEHFKFYEHDKWCTYWKYFRQNKYHRRRKHYKHYNKSKWAGFLQVNISFSNTRKCVGLLHNYFWVSYLPMRENQSNLRLISLLHSRYYGRHATLLPLPLFECFFFQGKIHRNNSIVEPFLTGTESGSSFKHYKIETAFDLCTISEWVSSKFFAATHNWASIYFRHS